MKFNDFVYCVESPIVWAIILLISLRAIYTCSKENDIAHLGAFIAVACGSAYMLGAGLGIFQMPTVFK